MKLSKKVVLLGHFGVGKTSLFRRFIDNEFSEDYKVTLGVQIKKKVIEMPDGRELSMIIWDTEGHTDIEDTRKSYLLGSNAFIYVFDLTRIDTYKDLNQDLEYLSKNHPKVKVKVIGNKLDLVNEKDVTKKFEELNITVDCLTSAKTNKNVQDFFTDLAKEITA
ncbi:GTP-binding protein [Aquimarina sp. MMG015]|uniref:Rab family GTPase n=1 Tax=unclassified Aquimarina TaxID=2627091 RepID=UPI000E52D3D0|nr:MULTISPECIES: Rab family GTPase [unclassified Aquimarina]AXT57612.1 GTP-binding protein [Aquimarina sp. AD1]MBQ4805166.1 GTP-binding protein [Aquimarina sp. MMG015]RKN28271.1 GTP-binding protein [Aquimarina sp. AD1]